MSGADDLSGTWSGIFNYPRVLRPTAFAAELHDAGGTLTGEITEPGQVGDARGRTLHAWVEGHHTGTAIVFTKTYDDRSRDHDRVEYEGSVVAEGNEIHGRWTIAGSWSGSFIMIRSEGRTTEVERRIAEPVGS